MVKLPQLSCIAFRVLAEGLVWSRASGHRTRWGSWKCGWWGLGDLLSKVANPFLLLILGQGQQEHVPGRGHIVVYCRGWHKVFAGQESNLINMTSNLLYSFQGWPFKHRNDLCCPNNRPQPKDLQFVITEAFWFKERLLLLTINNDY